MGKTGMPVASQQVNKRALYKGKPAVIRAYYKYADGAVMADINQFGKSLEVPLNELEVIEKFLEDSDFKSLLESYQATGIEAYKFNAVSVLTRLLCCDRITANELLEDILGKK